MADMTTPPATGQCRPDFLTFAPHREEQGVTILTAGSSTIPRPHSLPGYVRGILMLPDSLIPVVDLRPEGDPAPRSITAIVVLRLHEQSVGFMADPTRDVVRWTDEEPFPDLLAHEVGLGPADKARLDGLTRPGEEVVILVDCRTATGRPVGHGGPARSAWPAADNAPRVLAHVA
jgi:chemotaxis signal transduction protein